MREGERQKQWVLLEATHFFLSIEELLHLLSLFNQAGIYFNDRTKGKDVLSTMFLAVKQSNSNPQTSMNAQASVSRIMHYC
uniref:Uncharacterized protein n=1 Tax=Nelumbo nucifera TaxID=4432 RepID=A0A822ZE25_NELNU|nr:TPA_asm: hypothetical protein HUJ06_015589 [Nelumbo nucifera]